MKNLITYQQAQEYAAMANSYTRLPLILALKKKMRESMWFKLLGDSWSCCDNISQYDGVLRRVLKNKSHTHLMMGAKERLELEAMPEVVKVYRGCGTLNEKGLCWTTDRAIAEKFPTMLRYRAPDPQLVTAIVAKRDIVALKLDRGESEVITLRPRLVRIDRLTVTAQ